LNYKELRGAKKVPEKILARSKSNGFNGSKHSKQNLAKDSKFAPKYKNIGASDYSVMTSNLFYCCQSEYNCIFRIVLFEPLSIVFT